MSRSDSAGASARFPARGGLPLISPIPSSPLDPLDPRNSRVQAVSASPQSRLCVLLALLLSLLLSLVPGCRNPTFESRLAAAEVAADRQAVIELINRYAYGLDRGDPAALEAIFLPDAVAEYVGVDNPLDVRLEGIDAILAWLRETDHGRSPPGHYMATHVVEVDGDEARLTAYQHNRDVSGAGLYTIDARRTQNGWRIARLHLDQHLLESISDPGARRKNSP